MSYPATERTTPRRRAHRIVREASVVNRILDEVLTAHVATIIDGRPWLAPMVFARLDQTVYLHSSSGARLALAAERAEPDGLDVVLSVSTVDSLVLATTPGNHSADYRSVIAHGKLRRVTTTAEAAQALGALLDRVGEGRAADAGPVSDRDLSAVAVLALDLREVAAKIRNEPPARGTVRSKSPSEPWSGVVPLISRTGVPRRAETCVTELPGYLGSPWWDDPTLTGRHVRLEPLHASHVEGLCAAGSDPEVWRWMPTFQPESREAMAEWVVNALGQCTTGNRLPWAQVDLATGEVAGSTSYYEIDPENGSLAIGYTWLGRRWWRTALNTEAKLLLLERAFTGLGATRVTWHTDVNNWRSQQAIERIGGVKEGVIRSHRRRPDGTRRDTVVYGMLAQDWPGARGVLLARLDRPENVVPGRHDGHHDATRRS